MENLLYRRLESVGGQWVSMQRARVPGETVKTLNQDGLKSFISAVWWSARLADASLPLPLGYCWELAWSIGATGDVCLRVFMRENGERTVGVVAHKDWQEIYDGAFWDRFSFDSMQLRYFTRRMSKHVALVAQLPLI